MSSGALLQSDGTALINDMGYDVTFRRVIEGAYDPATGQTGASSTDDETAKVYFAQYTAREVDGKNIERGDRKALLRSQGLSKEPQTGDQFVSVGDTVNVVNVTRVRVNGVVALYICQVRE